MSRRSFLVALALVALLLAGAGLVFFLVVGYEPDVYAQAQAPEDKTVRAEQSRLFLTAFFDLLHDSSGSEQTWSVQFTDTQVNSYLQEGFVREGLAPRYLPDGVSQPHVVFEPNKAHLAFRYGADGWNTVITIDLRIWLAREEPNAVVLELESVRAGALPISGQWLIEEFAKAGRKYGETPLAASADGAPAGMEDMGAAGREGGGLDVTWYRLNGHPVALLRFQAEQAHPTLLLQDVRLDQGALTIHGRSPEAALHTLLLQLPPGTSKQILD